MKDSIVFDGAKRYAAANPHYVVQRQEQLADAIRTSHRARIAEARFLNCLYLKVGLYIELHMSSNLDDNLY